MLVMHVSRGSINPPLHLSSHHEGSKALLPEALHYIGRQRCLQAATTFSYPTYIAYSYLTGNYLHMNLAMLQNCATWRLHL